MTSKMRIIAVVLLIMCLAGCGINKYNKIHFVKQLGNTDSVNETEDILSPRISDPSNIIGFKSHRAPNSAKQASDSIVIIKGNNENMIASNNLFIELPIDYQIIDQDETENLKNTFVLKNRDQKENSQYRIKVKAMEKEGINPPLFAFLIITLVIATLLLGLLTFLSFSLGNGSGIPLLVLTLLFILLIVITIKSYNGN